MAATTAATPTGAHAGSDTVMQPALNQDRFNSNGNPGGDNPGVAPMGSAPAGINADGPSTPGWENPDALQNRPADTPLGTGGMAGTGLIGQPPATQSQEAHILSGGDPTVKPLGVAPSESPYSPNRRDDEGGNGTGNSLAQGGATQPLARDIDGGVGEGLTPAGGIATGTGSGQPGSVTGANDGSR